MEASILWILSVLALAVFALYVWWTTWVKTKHLVPLLNRALESLTQEFDDRYRRSFTLESAKSWLYEIREYQQRLWILKSLYPGNREYWDQCLKYREQLCLNFIGAQAAGTRSEEAVV